MNPTALIIIDGFGHNPSTQGNAILHAQTPHLDELWSLYPHTLLKAGEEEVGLNFGQIGNSEVGHMAIGSGRIIPSPLQRINQSLQDKTFETNKAFLDAIGYAKTNGSSLHLIGMISSAGVHAEISHMMTLLSLAKKIQVPRVFLHVILDGRDTGPKEAPIYISQLEQHIRQLSLGVIASASGRAYAMDRNNNWDRIKSFYDVLIGAAHKGVYTNIAALLEASYAQGLDDERIPPTLLVPQGAIRERDAVIVTNFREDRARQLTQALSLPDFSQFTRSWWSQNIYITTMTEYQTGLPVAVAFPKTPVPNTLSDVLEANGYRQLHIAETEKYAHTTYFINGGRETSLPNEDFVNIKSDPPEKFLQNPGMQSYNIAQYVAKDIQNHLHDFYMINFAAPDMIGHTGSWDNAVAAVTAVDQAVGIIAKELFLREGNIFITSDHGNAEQKIHVSSKEASKDHTVNPVPFMACTSQLKREAPIIRVTSQARVTGILQDVAPTILQTLKIPVPPEMTGAPVFSAL